MSYNTIIININFNNIFYIYNGALELLNDDNLNEFRILAISPNFEYIEVTCSSNFMEIF